MSFAVFVSELQRPDELPSRQTGLAPVLLVGPTVVFSGSSSGVDRSGHNGRAILEDMVTSTKVLDQAIDDLSGRQAATQRLRLETLTASRLSALFTVLYQRRYCLAREQVRGDRRKQSPS